MNTDVAIGRRMTRDEIIAKLRETAPALRAEGVMRLAIFGSRARGDAGEDSDLDVLIDVTPDAKFSLLDLVGVERTIGKITGIKTQAEMRRSLEQRFAQRIADDLIEVF
jgi:uncharacterized protein